ncbi:hypothetical protein CHS0354_026753, partial [Potamilus streckersoni]
SPIHVVLRDWFGSWAGPEFPEGYSKAKTSDHICCLIFPNIKSAMSSRGKGRRAADGVSHRIVSKYNYAFILFERCGRKDREE